ncbi:hypothetical protein J7T55_009651 [Diaporthe amygdali]|uniref:uncharacterized protein n=1 Tax=Phomopsis amygdali TaxID=1214568 RepID=UPI0022FDC6EB|nr:uncharacterized protein J7T55_009651 [Diaporthe amygdali]KAJ0109319.1 hypothetical protein J7T55_009651 [Diaporthe amygdali]
MWFLLLFALLLASPIYGNPNYVTAPFTLTVPDGISSPADTTSTATASDVTNNPLGSKYTYFETTYKLKTIVKCGSSSTTLTILSTSGSQLSQASIVESMTGSHQTSSVGIGISRTTNATFWPDTTQQMPPSVVIGSSAPSVSPTSSLSATGRNLSSCGPVGSSTASTGFEISDQSTYEQSSTSSLMDWEPELIVELHLDAHTFYFDVQRPGFTDEYSGINFDGGLDFDSFLDVGISFVVRQLELVMEPHDDPCTIDFGLYSPSLSNENDSNSFFKFEVRICDKGIPDESLKYLSDRLKIQ